MIYFVQISRPVLMGNKAKSGGVNLQRSYEICRAVVEKSANRVHVENQLVPPPPKQPRLSPPPLQLPPGAVLLATNQDKGRFSVGQAISIRSLTGGGVGGIAGTAGGVRIRLPVSAVPLLLPQSAMVQNQVVRGGVTEASTHAAPASRSLDLVSGLGSPSVVKVDEKTAVTTTETVSAPLLSCLTNHPAPSLRGDLSTNTPISSFLSSNSHLSLTSQLSPSLVGSQQVVVRYQYLPSSLVGSPPILLQSQPISPLQSLQVSVQDLVSNRFQVISPTTQGVQVISPSSQIQNVQVISPSSQLQGMQVISPTSQIQGVQVISPTSQIQGVQVLSPSSQIQGVQMISPSSQIQGVQVISPSSQLQGVQVISPSSQLQGVQVISPNSQLSFIRSPQLETTSRAINPTIMIQQIRKPITPPPSAAPPGAKPTVIYRQTRPRLSSPLQPSPLSTHPTPATLIQPSVNPPSLQPVNPTALQQSPTQSLASTQQIILQQVTPSDQAPAAAPPPPAAAATGVRTVMKTTLVPRTTTFSQSQINSILKQMLPEPPSPANINEEEKEKAQAIAAVAVSKYEATVAGENHTVQTPIIQPLELPEALSLPSSSPATDGQSLENVLIPELPENFLEKFQERSAAQGKAATVTSLESVKVG